MSVELAAIRAVADAARAVEKAARETSDAAEQLRSATIAINIAVGTLKRTLPAVAPVPHHYDSLGRPVYGPPDAVPLTGSADESRGVLADRDSEVVEHPKEAG